MDRPRSHAPCTPFLAGFTSMTVQRAGIMACPSPRLGARLTVDTDLTPLFPYLNRTVPGARYLDAPERVQFVFDGIHCHLYAHDIIAAAFQDHDQVVRFGERLLCHLNGLHARKGVLEPDFRRVRPVPALEVYRILPRTNCGRCGQPSCLAFAGALATGRADLDQCPGLAAPMEQKAVYPVLDRQGRLTGTVALDLPARHAEPAGGRPALAALLTGREFQVLGLLARGASYPEIARTLAISPHTVKSHVVHIYDKLGVRDRAQAAALAVRHRLI
ncbi:MAG: LuxR C-terminal-related transcriptional regulator [Thermodesulfobacteriota bacterium]